MGNVEIALLLIVLTVAVVLLAVRLRTTAHIGGSIQLKDESGNRLSAAALLAKELAKSGSAKPLVTISMTTRTVDSGSPDSTEVITIDGQTYHSVDEIPPEVRERVRGLLAKARATGGAPAIGADAALIRIERDLADLGLDVHHEPGSSETPPSAT